MTTITINRAVLEQVLESLKELVADPECDFGPSYELQKDRQKKAITAIREVLAQPERPAVQAKPVAWRWKPSEVFGDYVLSTSNDKVLTAESFGMSIEPLFTHPAPAREWVGLTDDEVDDLALDENGLPNSHIEFARAIEAALKAKNGGAA